MSGLFLLIQVLLSAERTTQDLDFAKRICEELQLGDTTFFGELVDALNSLFLSFARRRLFNPKDSEDVVQSFWEELMNARAICAYAESTDRKATLRTFLLGILLNRIVDANRKTRRHKGTHLEGKDLSDEKDQIPTPQNGLLSSSSQTMARTLVHSTLLRLSEDFPRDASLVRMHLEGLSYSQMAEKLGKKSDAIKKQFTREPTGSLAKFKIALKQIMHTQGIRYEDI